jgi:hypothetical protein
MEGIPPLKGEGGAEGAGWGSGLTPPGRPFTPAGHPPVPGLSYAHISVALILQD